MRYFSTGATRDVDDNKLDFEGFLDPDVIQRYGEFMHIKRYQEDGKLRSADNWQKGIPLSAYMKSLWRHFLAVWLNHRHLVMSEFWGDFPEDREQVEEDLCALLFNAMGYLSEVLKDRNVPDS